MIIRIQRHYRLNWGGTEDELIAAAKAYDVDQFGGDRIPDEYDLDDAVTSFTHAIDGGDYSSIGWVTEITHEVLHEIKVEGYSDYEGYNAD